MIVDHTFGETVLHELDYHFHRLTLTGGWLRRLWIPESPTDYPRIATVPARLIGVCGKSLPLNTR